MTPGSFWCFAVRQEGIRRAFLTPGRAGHQPAAGRRGDRRTCRRASVRWRSSSRSPALTPSSTTPRPCYRGPGSVTRPFWITYLIIQNGRLLCVLATCHAGQGNDLSVCARLVSAAWVTGGCQANSQGGLTTATDPRYGPVGDGHRTLADLHVGLHVGLMRLSRCGGRLARR